MRSHIHTTAAAAHSAPSAGTSPIPGIAIAFAIGLAIGIILSRLVAAKRQSSRRRHHARLRAERWQWQ